VALEAVYKPIKGLQPDVEWARGIKRYMDESAKHNMNSCSFLNSESEVNAQLFEAPRGIREKGVSCSLSKI